MKTDFVESKITELTDKLDPATDKISDEMFRNNDKNNIHEHDAAYSRLLNSYVDYATHTLINKKEYKRDFSLLSMWLMGILVVMMIVPVAQALAEKTMGDWVVSLIISEVTFAVAFLGLIKIVIKYVYNEKDEENITNIIKTMQSYDSMIRKDMNNKKEQE